MCIIAVSKKGVKQPTLKQLRTMYDNNPDGAGYMVARDGIVRITKGFMTWQDFERAVKTEKFTADDPVVYHFRISTQAGVQPSMTHPFPLTTDIKLCEKLDLLCPIGIAHNGIIHLTTDYKQKRFSDTALFITRYMTKLIHTSADIADPYVDKMIDELTSSKWAILDGASGDIVTVGKFVEDKSGLLFSNYTYAFEKWSYKGYNYGGYTGKGKNTNKPANTDKGKAKGAGTAVTAQPVDKKPSNTVPMWYYDGAWHYTPRHPDQLVDKYVPDPTGGNTSATPPWTDSSLVGELGGFDRFDW